MAIPIIAGAAGTAGVFQVLGQVFAGLRTGANAVESVVDTANKHLRVNSLTRLAQPLRIEPRFIFDSDLMTLAWKDDLAQAFLSNYAAYFIQALKSMGSVGGVSVGQKLAPFNPNRSFSLLSNQCTTLNLEHYRYSLPSPHKKPHETLVQQLTLESSSVGVDARTVSNIQENAGLSVGKIFTVTLVDGKNTAEAPLAIRLLTKVVPSRHVVEMLGYKNYFNTEKRERKEAYKSGEMSALDYYLMRDLLKVSRNAQINDKTNVLNDIQKRAANNFAAGLKSNSPSLNSRSTLVAISSETAQQLEAKLGGPLSNPKIREVAFNNAEVMILAVVDKEWETVNFYHDGMSAVLETDRSGVRAAGKKDGNEIVELMKAFLQGKPSI